MSAPFKGELFPKDPAIAETLASGQAALHLQEEARQGRPAVIFVYTPRGTTREPSNSTAVWLPYRVRSDTGKAGARGAP